MAKHLASKIIGESGGKMLYYKADIRFVAYNGVSAYIAVFKRFVERVSILTIMSEQRHRAVQDGAFYQ
jgi:hypothetical protein